MTVRRPPRGLIALLVIGTALLAVGATGCTGIASPKGWAAPQSTGDLILAPYREELHAFAFDNLDDERWTFPVSDEDDIDPEALYGSPAGGGGLVFIPTHQGTLYALDAETGEVEWEFETDGALIGGVVVGDGVVYLGSSDGNIYALDNEGRLVADPFEAGGEVWSSPALAGDTLYVTSLGGKLYALDAATLTEQWSFETGAGVASPAVVNEEANLVYVAGFDGKLRAISTESRDEQWAVSADNWFWTRPLLANGGLFAGSLDSRVYAVDAVTGEDLWRAPFETQAPVRAAPVMVNDVLVVADRGGNVYGIDVETGRSVDELLLEDDVLADLLARTVAGEAEGDPPVETVLIVTTGGDLIEIEVALDPVRLINGTPRALD